MSSETFYKILVEPSKSNKSTCYNCKANISEGVLRLKVSDARELNEYIRTHGGRSAFHGEGMSRGGYIEGAGPRGECISVKKYFVHLNCYEQIESHPWEKEYFLLNNFKPHHRVAFDEWLVTKNKPKKKPNKKQTKKVDEIKETTETKKISERKAAIQERISPFVKNKFKEKKGEKVVQSSKTSKQSKQKRANMPVKKKKPIKKVDKKTKKSKPIKNNKAKNSRNNK